MADRTANTVFYPSTEPLTIMGKTNASNDDTFVVPYGQVVECLMNCSDDDDAIATAVCSGSTVTIGLIDDEGNGVTADTDILFEAILKHQ